MGKREAHVILNPAANRGRSSGLVGEVSDHLSGAGISRIWHVTEETGHAERIAAGLPEDAFVVAVGGDGTIHEVAAACAGSERTLGIVPAGSGNDYVKSLGINAKTKLALKTLTGGKVREVDIGEVNGVRFNNGLGIGFDAEVAAGVMEAPAFLGGTGRYLWSVGKLLVGFECHEARMELDGEVVEAETILIAVALGTTYGARFKLAPEAKLDDGLFEVVWSERVDRRDVMRILPSAAAGTLYRHAEIHNAKAAAVRVEMAETVPAHVDGELLPETKSFDAKVLPGALRVVAP